VELEQYEYRVRYECWSERDKVSEAVEMNDACKKRVECLAFRNFLEVNEER
jgi:hypothetical protein